MVCVWPLVEGLQGVDGAGQACTLVAGRRGWMAEPAARAAQLADEVQFMAGVSPQEMRAPRIKPMAAETSIRRKRRYNRTDIQAETP